MFLSRLFKSDENIATKEHKKFFHQNGFLIFETDITDKIIKSIVDNLSCTWSTCSPPEGLINRDQQIKWLEDGHSRLQDAWAVINEVREVALNIKIRSILQYLFDSTPKPFQTINFHKGTEQDVHSDTIHFNSEPFGLMCGVWVAFEDIGDFQGPLLYYPRSHRLPEITNDMFDFTIEARNYPRIVEYWKSCINEFGFEAKKALLKKGQAIVWHANLLHGGSFQIDKSKTRNSQVTHYFFDGAKPWRQLQSSVEREYFEPHWIY